MKKIIAFAMGIITFFTGSDGNASLLSTPTGSHLPMRYLDSLTDTPNFIRKGITEQQKEDDMPCLSAADWNSSPLTQVASYLNPFIYQFDQTQPVADPIPVTGGNAVLTDFLYQSFKKEHTNHFAIVLLVINDKLFHDSDPVIFLSGSDNEHIRVDYGKLEKKFKDAKGIGKDNEIGEPSFETLGSVGYKSKSAQVHAHSEKAAMLWILNEISSGKLPINSSTGKLKIYIKIAHEKVCNACRCFLSGKGYTLENTNIIVGKSNQDKTHEKISLDIWDSLPANTEIYVSNDKELLLDVKERQIIFPR